MPQEHLAELAKAFGDEEEGDDEFDLWPGTEPAVNAFLLVTGQWRIASSMAGITYVGLDYGAARGVWRDHGIKLTPAFWSDLRVLEDETRNLLNDRDS